MIKTKLNTGELWNYFNEIKDSLFKASQLLVTIGDKIERLERDTNESTKSRDDFISDIMSIYERYNLSLSIFSSYDCVDVGLCKFSVRPLNQEDKDWLGQAELEDESS